MSADELVTFLLARLDEEQRACGTNGDPESWCDRAEGLHHDSRHVLAEIATKRAIIEATGGWQHDDPDDGGYYACPALRSEPLGDLGPESFGEENCNCGVRARRRQIVMLLVQPYADHPHFHPSWAIS